MKITIESDDAEVAKLLARLLGGGSASLTAEPPLAEEEARTEDGNGELVSREAYHLLTGLHVNTISRYYEAGQLKGKRMGRRLFIYKNQK